MHLIFCLKKRRSNMFCQTRKLICSFEIDCSLTRNGMVCFVCNDLCTEHISLFHNCVCIYLWLCVCACLLIKFCLHEIQNFFVCCDIRLLLFVSSSVDVLSTGTCIICCVRISKWQSRIAVFLWKPFDPSLRFSSGAIKMTAACLSMSKLCFFSNIYFFLVLWSW